MRNPLPIAWIAILSALPRVAPAGELAGVVLDQRGKPYAGVQVGIAGTTAKTYTDAKGAWRLSATKPTGVATPGTPREIRWTGHALQVSSAEPGTFSAVLVDLRGKTKRRIAERNLEAGTREFDWPARSPWLKTIVRWNGIRFDCDGAAEIPVAARSAFDTTFLYDSIVYSEKGVPRAFHRIWREEDPEHLGQFLINPSGPWDTLVDSRDGSTYRMVTIDGIQWTTQNLRYRPATGLFQEVTPGAASEGLAYSWATANALPGRCDSTDCFALVTEPRQGICPTGWSLPSTSDWTSLQDPIMAYDQFATAAQALNAVDSRWALNKIQGTQGTGFFGFDLLPSAMRLWTSTPFSTDSSTYLGWVNFRCCVPDWNTRAQSARAYTGITDVDDMPKTYPQAVRCRRRAP